MRGSRGRGRRRRRRPAIRLGEGPAAGLRDLGRSVDMMVSGAVGVGGRAKGTGVKLEDTLIVFIAF